MSNNSLNNPLLNDRVIERDYGLSELVGNEPKVKAEPIVKEKIIPPNNVEQPTNLGNQNDIDDANVNEFAGEEFDPSNLQDLGIDIDKMKFVDDTIENDPLNGEEEPQTGAQTVKPDNAAVKSLASVITGIVSQYLPKLAAYPAKQNMDEINEAVALRKLPANVIPVFEKRNEGIDNALKLTDEEIRGFNKALVAYLKTKEISDVSEGHALLLQGGIIVARLAITTLQLRNETQQLKEHLFLEWSKHKN